MMEAETVTVASLGFNYLMILKLSISDIHSEREKNKRKNPECSTA